MNTPAYIDRLEDMKRLEGCFLTPKGEIDLMEMSVQVSEPVLREYFEASREWRARRKAGGR